MSTTAAQGVAPEDHASPTAAEPAIYVDRLVRRLSQLGDRPCLRHQSRDVPAAALLSSIYRYARALAGLGISRGEVVALFPTNCPDALAVRYAANLIGAGATFLSAPHTPEARSKLIAAIDPTLLVVFPETRHLVPRGTKTRVAGIGFAPVDGVRLGEIALRQSGDPVGCGAHPD